MSALSFTQRLASPPDRVFAALHEARHLEHWFCDRCESTPGEGGRLRMEWKRAGSSSHPFEARWVNWVWPSLLAFHGGHAGYPNGDAGVVSFGLMADGAGTTLQVRHAFPDGDGYARFRHEWEQAWPRALARLAAHLSSFAIRGVVPRFERYVALGDSSTEGLMDRDGSGFRGWSRRLAQAIADAQGGLWYANLGRRGLTTREIREGQLPVALRLEPDLATVFSGTNDVLRPRFDVQAFVDDVRAIQQALRARGTTVVTFNLPDLAPLLPWARPLSGRIRAMNVALRAACEATGTRLVDFAAHPVAVDARLWDPDRIHANPIGHARIAEALAHALELPGSDATWADALPEETRASALHVTTHEIGWAVRHLVPWTLGLFAPRPAPAANAPAPELTRLEPSPAAARSAHA